MNNPYRQLPNSAFWRRAVVVGDVDPVSPPPFKIAPTDNVATAGSCFAQHIARTLRNNGFCYLVTEDGAEERNFGVFTARFGNLYTARQLWQLFQRAYGLFDPGLMIWKLEDRLVDAFRPQVEPSGFASHDELLADRERHLGAVRAMFETSDVFIFTLGLTEAWASKSNGAVFPLAPGVAGGPTVEADDVGFHNFTVAETVADLRAFITSLRMVNPAVRIVLTVSPVPLIATYEPQHVLVSTIYSKSVLRVAAEEIVRGTEGVAYYPSYEIITGHHTRYEYFAEDLRSVTNNGVDRAMDLFTTHYLTTEECIENIQSSSGLPLLAPGRYAVDYDELYSIVCDEEALDQ